MENKKAFEVSYMPWDDFKAVLVSPRSSPENQRKWNLIHSQDCIIGGVDYTIDTSYVQNQLLVVQFQTYHTDRRNHITSCSELNASSTIAHSPSSHA